MQRKVDNHFGSFLEGFQLGGEDPFGKYEKVFVASLANTYVTLPIPTSKGPFTLAFGLEAQSV